MKIMQRLSGSFSAAAFVALATTFVPFGMGVSISSSAVAAVLPDFTDLVDKVGPAVVNIRTTERAKGMQPGQGAPGSEDEEMQEFFRRFFGQPPGAQPPGGQRPQPSPRGRKGGPQGGDAQQPAAQADAPATAPDAPAAQADAPAAAPDAPAPEAPPQN